MNIKNSILNFFKNDWHFLLLIIFFITHGYAEYVSLVPVWELMLLLAVLVAVALVLYLLFKRLLRDRRKAAVFMTMLLGMFLFFGVFQDFLGQFRVTSALAQLHVLFPVSIVVLAGVFILLRMSGARMNRLTMFLNVLLLLYILIDIVVISAKLVSPAAKDSGGLAACDTCARPPVYFILLDEYSGADALKGYFNYDNSVFENFLQSEGFKVTRHTNSNYVFTVFSMASMLNMDYLGNIGEQSAQNHYGYRKATEMISTNAVTRFFNAQGYRINNYSYFQLPASSPVFKTDYLPGEVSLITHKTMYSRVIKEAVRVLANKFSIDYFIDKSEAAYVSNNEAMIKKALETASQSNTQPSFTYLHLMLPHDPIAFDSTGKQITPFRKRASYNKKDVDSAYLQYLVYANSRMRSFISELKQKTVGQAIIVVMSDHGYRGSKVGNDVQWVFNNLNAIYLPQKNYNAWYDGMSNVNQFRALLNTSFGQKLPMLKDSLVK